MINDTFYVNPFHSVPQLTFTPHFVPITFVPFTDASIQPLFCLMYCHPLPLTTNQLHSTHSTDIFHFDPFHIVFHQCAFRVLCFRSILLNTSPLNYMDWTGRFVPFHPVPLNLTLLQSTLPLVYFNSIPPNDNQLHIGRAVLFSHAPLSAAAHSLSFAVCSLLCITILLWPIHH